MLPGPADPARPTLIVCLHPRCPCSDATLDALETLLDRFHNAAAYVLFSTPDRAKDDWNDAALVRRAKAMARLTVILDAGGRQTSLLGAKASGQTFLYDTAHRLIFAGGLTPGRGERGRAAGTQFIADVLSGSATSPPSFHTPVFGCALYRPTEGSVR